MRKWELQNNFQFSIFNFKLDKLLDILIQNRGLKTKKQIEEFLNPKLESLTIEKLGISKKDLEKSLKRIEKALAGKEKIIVFGDYDVDGVTGTAILWETLNALGADVMPYIPHRIEEGYGLSIKGISNIKSQMSNVSLIITVDNGIVAAKAVEFANSFGIDVIITDHHIPSRKLPEAYGIIHSTLVCGAGVAYVFAREIFNFQFSIFNESLKIQNTKYKILEEHLGLAAIATVTDVMRLTSFNRTILKFGLPEIRKSKRPGILAIVKNAAIDQSKIGVYELGHVIGPRLNATGRLEHAMDSLRLLCTTNKSRAEELAKKLNDTNLERQQLTLDSFLHAKEIVGNKLKKKLIFIAHESYKPGVIGLVAGKLVEEYYRPSIVLSVGKDYTKASARSIAGFNIIEFIRLSSNLLVDAGGHPMAAGFTVETKRIKELQKLLEDLSEKHVREELLVRKLRIDCELDLSLISEKLFDAIQKLSPFGPGNPEPTFLAKNVLIGDIRAVGKDGRHLKLKIKDKISNLSFDGILFGYDNSLSLRIGDKADIVYTISENEWNGNKRLELKIRDLKLYHA